MRAHGGVVRRGMRRTFVAGVLLAGSRPDRWPTTRPMNAKEMP